MSMHGEQDPKDCSCPCHRGEPIFCSCFVHCCSRPGFDTRPPARLVLLTREDFKEKVFARDGNKCVMCGGPAQDAHHILERRLWGDGGYYIDNGVTVCGPHHIEAEKTTLGCEELRKAAGIKRIVLPSHLYRDQEYDKWGNPVLPNGTRLRGDLFFDESVQKILGEGNMLSLFTTHVKFPRTYHLPWSPGMTKDDRMMESKDPFAGKQVVVTVKMDGENTTMYRDYIHARSLSFESHESRTWVKTLHGRISYEIPEGWRVCGENLWAEHSIPYKNLDDHFLVFSVWNEKNICLSWEDTKLYASLLGFKTVPVLYEGEGSKKNIEKLYTPEFSGDVMEGYVVRRSGEFAYSEYRNEVGKFVRENHVTTHGGWIRQQVKPNRLREAK